MENYEEKYKHALECVQEILSGGQEKIALSRLKLRLQPFFPELKESEDERTRKGIIELVKQSSEILDKQNQNNMIAWLEKQGEKSPTENVEIKFCKGDKVVSNQDGKVYTVGTEYYVTGDNICLHADGNPGNHKWTNRDDLDKNYHLWTSEDAKKLNADDVIEWLDENCAKFWKNPCNPQNIIDKFKQDFDL